MHRTVQSECETRVIGGGGGGGGGGDNNAAAAAPQSRAERFLDIDAVLHTTPSRSCSTAVKVQASQQ